MEPTLDRTSAVPLYHQIAELLRYRIATARLLPGDELPPIRKAADIWCVNLHTVRRAYQALAELGLVETVPPHPTRVVDVARPEGTRAARLDRFLDDVLGRASELGLSSDALASLLGERTSTGPRHTGPVYVVECSETQARGHADELRRRFDVDAHPWSLEREDEPPAGELIATYFHYNDVRVRWPHRFDRTHFAAIAPDPEIAHRVPVPRASGRVTLTLCELDKTMALNVAADLTRVLGDHRYRIVPEVVARPARRLATRGRTPLLFPPRAWNMLSERERADPRAVEVSYVFEPRELDALGRKFSWRRRR